YNPTTNTWEAVASMQTARGNVAAAVGIDGRIYAIGGDVSAFGVGLASVEAYTPATNTWQTVASMPTGRTWAWATTAGGDPRIFVFGGSSSGPTLPVVAAYTP